MNTATIETPVTALTLPQRAAVALGTAEHEVKLRELVKASANIVAVLNADARSECHAAYMKLKTSRVAIDKSADAATEDAKAFTKAVKGEKERLIALMSAEEDRLQALRDKWDSDREAEKAAKIAAERARVEAIQARITEMRGIPQIAAGKPSDVISRLIASLEETVPDATYEEFEDDAKGVRLQILDQLAKMETTQRGIEIEAESARQEAERQRLAQVAEAARLKAEREELARDRAAQAERERVAKVESDRLAAEAKAEQDRKQAEFDAQMKAATERQKAAQDAIFAQQAEIDRQQAELVEAQRKVKEEEAERVRLQALHDQFLADHAEALAMNATWVKAVAEDDESPFDHPSYDPKPIIATAVRPTDEEIISVVSAHFEVEKQTAYGWLLEMQQDIEYL